MAQETFDFIGALKALSRGQVVFLGESTHLPTRLRVENNLILGVRGGGREQEVNGWWEHLIRHHGFSLTPFSEEDKKAAEDAAPGNPKTVGLSSDDLEKIQIEAAKEAQEKIDKDNQAKQRIIDTRSTIPPPGAMKVACGWSDNRGFLTLGLAKDEVPASEAEIYLREAGFTPRKEGAATNEDD